MNISDTVALSALLLAIVSALCAFLYWLIQISYKINMFIFELRTDVTEIKATMYDNQAMVGGLSRKLKYITYILKTEYPHYFKREEDNTNDPSN